MMLLEGFRALDLMEEKANYCGKILADFGIDVIKIERPSGDPGRTVGPFYHDIVDPERSLNWWAWNTNKKGITLNIETERGQELFKRLVGQADFLLESFSPGYMDKIGMGYPVLKEINPRLIYATLTPFGQTGPYKSYLATEIVAMAMGSTMTLTGNPERPPLRFFGEQAYCLACAYTAAGTIIAHYYRESTGEGQRVDVALADIPHQLTWREFYLWEDFKILSLWGGREKHPDGTVSQGRFSFRPSWTCKDGYISWSFPGSWPTGAKNNRAFVRELVEKEPDTVGLKEVNWEQIPSWAELTQQQREECWRIIGRYFAQYTKDELAMIAAQKGLELDPLCDIPDVMKNEQLEARGFWSEIEHEDLGIKLRYPGQPFISSETQNRTRRRAPHLGEHNELIYSQLLGLSAPEIAILKKAGTI